MSLDCWPGVRDRLIEEVKQTNRFPSEHAKDVPQQALRYFDTGCIEELNYDGLDSKTVIIRVKIMSKANAKYLTLLGRAFGNFAKYGKLSSIGVRRDQSEGIARDTPAHSSCSYPTAPPTGYMSSCS